MNSENKIAPREAIWQIFTNNNDRLAIDIDFDAWDAGRTTIGNVIRDTVTISVGGPVWHAVKDVIRRVV